MFQDNSMKSLYDIRILFKRLNFDFLKKIRKKKIPITQESIIIIHQKIRLYFHRYITLNITSRHSNLYLKNKNRCTNIRKKKKWPQFRSKIAVQQFHLETSSPRDSPIRNNAHSNAF